MNLQEYPRRIRRPLDRPHPGAAVNRSPSPHLSSKPPRSVEIHLRGLLSARGVSAHVDLAGAAIGRFELVRPADRDKRTLGLHEGSAQVASPLGPRVI